MTPILPETQPTWTRFPVVAGGTTASDEVGYGEGGYGEDGYDTPAGTSSDVPTPIWVVETLQ